MADSSQSNAELVQEILTGVRWALALKMLAQAFTWLSTLIVIRFLTPEDYGLNAMLESAFLMFALLATLGLDSALVQRKEFRAEELEAVFGWLLIVNVGLFLAFFFSSGLLAAHYNEPRLEPLAQVLAILFLIGPFRTIPNALLERALRFKLKAQVELVASVTAASATVVAAYLGAGVWALVGGLLVRVIMVVILMNYFQPWFVVPSFLNRSALKMMRFGGVVMLVNAATILSDVMVTVIAGPVLGATVFGAYALALGLAQMPLAKAMPVINQTLLPAFARFQSDPNAARYYLERVASVAALLLFPLLGGLAVIAGDFIRVIAGDNWTASILPLTIIVLGMMPRVHSGLYRLVLTSLGRPDLSLAVTLAQLLLVSVATLFLVDGGVVWVAVGWSATELAVLVLVIVASHRVIGASLTSFVKAILPAAIATAAMAIAVLATRLNIGWDQPLARLLLEVPVGAAVYWLVLRLAFPASLELLVRTLLGKHNK